MARQTHSPIDTIEAWDIDKFLAYGDSLRRVMKAEAGPRPRRPRGVSR